MLNNTSNVKYHNFIISHLHIFISERNGLSWIPLINYKYALMDLSSITVDNTHHKCQVKLQLTPITLLHNRDSHLLASLHLTWERSYSEDKHSILMQAGWFISWLRLYGFPDKTWKEILNEIWNRIKNIQKCEVEWPGRRKTFLWS